MSEALKGPGITLLQPMAAGYQISPRKRIAALSTMEAGL